MCTAATYKTKDFYFGRTLDYEFSYGEQVVITPMNYTLKFSHIDSIYEHYAIIGMAYVEDNYPLYYDAINDKGLGMAGLNFVGNAVYQQATDGYSNVAQFEFIPWVLAQCESVKEAKKLISGMRLVGTPFSERLPSAQLHWIIADKDEAITVECMADGMHVYDNSVGVLTNNPPFDVQMFELNKYMMLSNKQPDNKFSDKLKLEYYSRGMGALGLPGDLSSVSRFVRVAFTRLNSVSGDTESESMSQFFHILGSVEQQRGCCEVSDGKYEITIYTSCCNVTRGIYYYKTYDNQRIIAVDMKKENLKDNKLICYPIIEQQDIFYQN